MTRLVVLGGTGDAYLICALVAAFRAHHNRRDVEVVLHSKLAAVAALFPNVSYVIDDAIVRHAEDNQAFQCSYDNQLFASGLFYVHPCFARSGVRIDQLTAKESVSQADMYRVMLRLPLDAPLTSPHVPARRNKSPNTVLLLTESTSWPNTQPHFWDSLGRALTRIGRTVVVNDPRWPLMKLFEMAVESDWVIGPQCGVMSIFATGRFPCRKTFASPSTDNYVSPSENWWATRTFPYGYATKFAGEDYDIEEFRIEDDNHDEVITSIMNGSNALRLQKHHPQPVTTVTMPLTPGDFLDRLAVLTVKREMFSVERRAAIEREYLRYAERFRDLPMSDEVAKLYDNLVALHRRTFNLLEEAIPVTLNGGHRSAVIDHGMMVRLNRDRVALKNAIDRAMHAPYLEVKSYYDAPERVAAE